MTELQQSASLDEKTVQKVAKGEVEPAKKPRKKAEKKATKVVKIKPLTEVWEAAVKLAKGDTKLLLVLAEDCVIVMNHPDQWKR